MTTSTAQMQSPRIENGRELHLAGLSGRYNNQTMHTITQLWERFGQHIGHVPTQIGHVSYGVNHNPQPDHSTFDYLAAVEVAAFAGLPASGHVAAVTSGCPISFYERYDDSFNPISGLGTVELWLPIQP